MSQQETPTRPRTVLWATTNTHHAYTITLPGTPLPASSQKPAKSILKTSRQPFPDTNILHTPPRTPTPEPACPDQDDTYLSGPISVIISPGAGPDECNEAMTAYAALTTRIKSMEAVLESEQTNIAALKPFIANHAAIASAIERDLGRALEDPMVGQENLPPSPDAKASKETKQGMSDSQAKRSRDFAAVSMSAMRLLGVLFTIERMTRIFEQGQINALLTSLLAIPLAEKLPTTNSRKTYSLAMSVIAGLILPAEVIEPAAPRITYALHRALEGELGKEGKKGSIADSLKAIHTHVVLHPEVFTPLFVDFLPTIFSLLSSPTLSVRTSAVHAIAGIALSTRSYRDPTLPLKFEAQLQAHFVSLVRLLRTTLTPDSTTPSWALCLVASIIKISQGSSCALKIAVSVLPLAVKHKKVSVHALAGLVWRCLVHELLLRDQEHGKYGWKLINQAIESLGVALVAGRCGQGQFEEAMDAVKTMAKKGGSVCKEAVSIVKRFLSFSGVKSSPEPWNISKLAPDFLFDGTLLQTTYVTIAQSVKTMLTDSSCASILDIAPLEDEQVKALWSKMLAIWKIAATNVEFCPDGAPPTELADVWRMLLAARADDDQDLLGIDISRHLQDLLTDSSIASSNREDEDESTKGVKFAFVHFLWSIARDVLPSSTLEMPATNVLTLALGDSPDSFCSHWCDFIADLAVLAPSGEIQKVVKTVLENQQTTPEILEVFWKALASSWESSDGSWQDAAYLLALPFSVGAAQRWKWDEQAWETCLRISLLKANQGTPNAFCVINRIASYLISAEWHPAMPRATDIMFSLAGLADATIEQIPDLLSYTNTTLQAAYRNLTSDARGILTVQWLFRSLTRAVESMKSPTSGEFIVAIQCGIATWVQDQEQRCTWSQEAREYDVQSMYESMLLSLEETSLDDLHNLLPQLVTFYEAGVAGGVEDRGLSPAATLVRDHWKRIILKIGVPMEMPPDLKGFLRERCTLPVEARKVNVLEQGVQNALPVVRDGRSMSSEGEPIIPTEILGQLLAVGDPMVPKSPACDSPASASIRDHEMDVLDSRHAGFHTQSPPTPSPCPPELETVTTCGPIPSPNLSRSTADVISPVAASHEVDAEMGTHDNIPTDSEAQRSDQGFPVSWSARFSSSYATPKREKRRLSHSDDAENRPPKRLRTTPKGSMREPETPSKSRKALRSTACRPLLSSPQKSPLRPSRPVNEDADMLCDDAIPHALLNPPRRLVMDYVLMPPSPFKRKLKNARRPEGGDTNAQASPTHKSPVAFLSPGKSDRSDDQNWPSDDTIVVDGSSTIDKLSFGSSAMEIASTISSLAAEVKTPAADFGVPQFIL
ncbi:hypothetical protein SISSUDRAFT_1124457 [Sistotremastrum suecicum HHB10207 ss-3]|uniref:Telomere-associated protein Rif1 N-terminal domain-containing protein n=1 Tax=Sistotremastrum suecicum HHB10207 ss-3 TaxID=1314776 RepID=A0A166IIC8_9AGAM|nr:hypothetical protein SISSUDRAFT_1124457 [Sistotremastrum suecicum HHB10207 ss-3]